MENYRPWIRKTLQAIMLAMVGWGVYHTVSQSMEQLSERRRELIQKAAAVRQQAAQTTDAARSLELVQQASQLENQIEDFWKASPRGLLLAGAIYAVGMIPAAFFWHRCLISLSQPVTCLNTLWAYFYGNLGKYFPGKAMVIVLRLSALTPCGVARGLTIGSIFLETLTMMAVGGAVAAASMLLLNLDWRLSLLASALLIATFVPTYPPLMRLLVERLLKSPTSGWKDWTNAVDGRLLATGWGMLLVTWLCFGASLLCVLWSLKSSQLPAASGLVVGLSVWGACALAVVLGFVSLIPGGAGVREVVLSLVLTPIVGPTAALCGAVWLRIVWLVTEVAVVLTLAGWRGVKRGTRGPPVLAGQE